MGIYENMGYNNFIKMMFSMGFDWVDIEYYWRNQDELYELLNKKEELTEEQQRQKERNSYITSI